MLDWAHTLLRTGKVLENLEWTRLDKYMNTQSAQDWTSTWTHRVHKTGKVHAHTHSGEDWQGIATHRVHRTSQSYKDSKCTALAKCDKTQSAQDWVITKTNQLLRTGKVHAHTEWSILGMFKNTQNLLTPAHHSNTAGTWHCKPDWAHTHTLLRTG